MKRLSQITFISSALVCLLYSLPKPGLSLTADSYKPSAIQNPISAILTQQPGEPVSQSCSAIGAHVPQACWIQVNWEEVGRLPGEWPMINSEEAISIGQNTIVRNGAAVNYDLHSSHDGYVRYAGNCQTYSVSIIRVADAPPGYATHFLSWFHQPTTVTIDGRTYRNPSRSALEIACSSSPSR